MFTVVKHKSSILALTLFCFVVGSAWMPNQLSQESICLIPEGFTGPVFIIFGQAGGAEPEIENGKHLYRIPRSGVLKTKVKADYRLHRHEFYYVGKRGRRTKLEYLYPVGGPRVAGERTFDDVDHSGGEVFCMTNEMGTENRGGGVIYFRQFLVGRAGDAERMALKRDQSTGKALRGAKPSRARRQ